MCVRASVCGDLGKLGRLHAPGRSANHLKGHFTAPPNEPWGRIPPAGAPATCTWPSGAPPVFVCFGIVWGVCGCLGDDCMGVRRKEAGAAVAAASVRPPHGRSFPPSQINHPISQTTNPPPLSPSTPTHKPHSPPASPRASKCPGPPPPGSGP